MFQVLFPKGSLRRVVANNTVSQLFGRVISSIAVVIVSLLIAKRYGPDGYGDFVKITTYVGFFYLFADFGLNAVYVQRIRENLKDPAESAAVSWQMLLGLRLCLSAFLVVLSLIIVSLFPVGDGQGYTTLVRLGILLLAPVIIAQAVTTTTNAYFQQVLRYDLSTIAQNVGSVVMLACALSLTYFTSTDGPLLGVISVIFGSVATAMVAVYLVRIRIRSVWPRLDRAEFIVFMKRSSPLGIALVFNLIYFHSDSVILALYRSTRDVGVYGLAYKVFELLLVVPIFFMNSVYPLMITSVSGKTPSTNIYRRSMQFLLSSSLFLGVVMWIVSPMVVYIRNDFADSIVPLRILLGGLPIFYISAYYMWFIISKNMQRALLWIHGLAMTGNILFNFVFVPAYGYLAAAWITVGSELFVLVASVFVVRYSLKIKTRDK